MGNAGLEIVSRGSELNEFNVGDIVKITNGGGVFSGYFRWAELHNLTNWESGRCPREDNHFKVIVLSEHLTYPKYGVIAAIEDLQTGEQFIYNTDSLELVEGVKMTPCEKLGLKVGDKFIFIKDCNYYEISKGTVVELVRDDGDEAPFFRVLSGSVCSLFDFAEKIESTKLPGTVEQETVQFAIPTVSFFSFITGFGDNQRRATAAYKLENGTLYIGITECSAGDKYSYKIGQEEAVKALQEKPFVLPFSQALRIAGMSSKSTPKEYVKFTFGG